jgi:ribonucleotide reductase alpha subunit
MPSSKLYARAVTSPHRAVALDADTAQVLRQLRLLGESLALEGAEAKASVILPVENPERLPFISWKKDRDVRHASLAMGRDILEALARRVMDSLNRDDPSDSPDLEAAMEDARRAGLPEAAIRMAISYAEQGYEDISFALPAEEKTAEDFIETALDVPDSFLEDAVTGHGDAEKTWDALAEAIWLSGAPTISFRDNGGEEAQTLLLPYAATVDDVRKAILSHWDSGVKTLRIYRENGTLLHALPAVQEDKTPKENQHIGKARA